MDSLSTVLTQTISARCSSMAPSISSHARTLGGLYVSWFGFWSSIRICKWPTWLTYIGWGIVSHVLCKRILHIHDSSNAELSTHGAQSRTTAWLLDVVLSFGLRYLICLCSIVAGLRKINLYHAIPSSRSINSARGSFFQSSSNSIRTCWLREWCSNARYHLTY